MVKSKNFKIWGVRHSLAGDMIFALPILNFLELQFTNSYKYWVIAKKCAGFTPLFYNHPLIDNIRITEEKESLSKTDIEIAKSCNIVINVAPQHPDGMPGTTEESCWWNYRDVYRETWRMAGLKVEYYNNLSPELQKPKLNQWFEVERENKIIGIWPFSSYGPNNKRSPSKKWYNKLIEDYLKKEVLKIYQFGADTDPKIHPGIIMCNSLPIFDQIKKSLGLDVNITTNSGSGAILGAYGVNQVTLLTDDAPNHKENLLAFAPANWKGNNINLFEMGGCDNINQEQVLESVKLLTSC